MSGLSWEAIKKWGSFLLPVIGTGIIMATANASAPQPYKLGPPGAYFSDAKSLKLLATALAGDLAGARQLVAEGADPNDEGPKSNASQRLRLLHYAIAAKNGPALDILLAVGADPELVVAGSGRAFIFALHWDNVEMLARLLDARPVTSLSHSTLKTLLFEAVVMSRQRCLALLLQRGAPIDLPNSAGYTIFMKAIDTGDFALAEWILQQGASVTNVTVAGVTPAYSLQNTLERVRPGTPAQQHLLRIKSLMAARGAVFPAPGPEAVRAQSGVAKPG